MSFQFINATRYSTQVRTGLSYSVLNPNVVYTWDDQYFDLVQAAPGLRILSTPDGRPGETFPGPPPAPPSSGGIYLTKASLVAALAELADDARDALGVGAGGGPAPDLSALLPRADLVDAIEAAADDVREALDVEAGAGSGFTAATAFAAETAGAIARPLAARYARALTLRDFGALGDGAADDSAAVRAAFVAAIAGGFSLGVEPGLYRVPDWQPLRVDAPLRVIGVDRGVCVLDMERTPSDAGGPLYMLGINAPVRLERLGFARCTTVLLASDGNPTTPNRIPGLSSGNYRLEPFNAVAATTRDVSGLTVRDCAFVDTRRPIAGHLCTAGHKLSRVRFEDNLIDGAWAGWMLRGLGYQDVLIRGNTYRNIDGTPAGYTAAGAPGTANPITFWSSMAVGIGMNTLQTTSAPLFDVRARWADNRNIRVFDDICEGVTDARLPKDIAPEVHYLACWSALDVSVENCHVRGVVSATADECESIYAKAVDIVIRSNVIESRSTFEATIVAKGTSGIDGTATTAPGRRVVIEDNVIRAARNPDGSYVPARGIVCTGTEASVKRNRLIGIGTLNVPGVTPLDAAAIKIYGDFGIANQVVEDNVILDCRAPQGIFIRTGGAGSVLYVRRNHVNEMTPAPLPDGNGVDALGTIVVAAYAVKYPSSDTTGQGPGRIEFEGNTCGAITADTALDTAMFRLEGGTTAAKALGRMVVKGNILSGAAKRGLRANIGRIARLELVDNDFSRASDSAVSSAANPVTSYVARNNAGYLEYDRDWTPGTVADGAAAATTFTGLFHVRPRCRCRVRPPYGLQGLLPFADCEAEGVVRVSLLNRTGAAVTLPLGSWRLTIEHEGTPLDAPP